MSVGGDGPEGDLEARLRRARVVPVVTLSRPEAAVPLAWALAAGGIDVVEITLRTDVAVEAIRAVAEGVPGVLVGAGTITRAEQLAACHAAGARFAVSPGLTRDLASAAVTSPLPLVPGVATASEAMAAAERGFRLLKLFPAVAAGGLTFLRAVAGPLPDLLFCPTGGVDGSTFESYLELPNVLCVGGSWVAPSSLIDAGDWPAITTLARGTTR